MYYTIDISQPVGSRISALKFVDGTPITDTTEFVMAVNNYRQNGGGSFPHMSGETKTVFDEQQEICQLLIEYGQDKKTINPTDFADRNWNLVTSTPAASVELSTAEAPVAGKLTVTATGLLPNTDVEFTMYSEPKSLGTVTADSSGKATLEVSVPDVDLGVHKIVAHQYGFVVDTTLRAIKASTTEPAPTETAEPAPSSKTTPAAPTKKTVKTTKKLSNTGVDVLPWAGATTLLLLGGTALVTTRRVKK